VFDADGVLRHLGVLLVPSPNAESAVEALGGARHTSGLRYSHDDPAATVIAVSEDGPVSVLRAGELLTRD
jgi:DNA integrity scanning protein DisA with diadenylate cyclase activity